MSVFVAIGKAGLLPPVLAAWTPNIIVSASAIYCLSPQRRKNSRDPESVGRDPGSAIRGPRSGSGIRATAHPRTGTTHRASRITDRD